MAAASNIPRAAWGARDAPPDSVLVQDVADREERAVGQLGELPQRTAGGVLLEHDGFDARLHGRVRPRLRGANKLAQQAELRSRRVWHGRRPMTAQHTMTRRN